MERPFEPNDALGGKAQQAAAILAALTHPARLRILTQLIDREMSARALANTLSLDRGHDVATSRKIAQSEPGAIPPGSANDPLLVQV